MALEWKELDQRLSAIEDRLGSIEAALSQLGGSPAWMGVAQAAEYLATSVPAIR